MNYSDIKAKIGSKTEELRKAEADESRLSSAVKAAEAEHVEALIAVELEESGAAGRVRKAEAELQKVTRAAEDASTRRKTLRAVLERMETEAGNLRRAELFAQREEAAERVLKREPKCQQALDAYLTELRGVAQELGTINDIERELDRLLLESERLNRIGLQLPLGSHIDLSQASQYAVEVGAQNRRRLEAIKLDPVQHTIIQGERRPALRAVG